METTKNKERLGKCPKCDNINYVRNDSEWIEDYIVVECICNNCNFQFTEYYVLNEVEIFE